MSVFQGKAVDGGGGTGSKFEVLEAGTYPGAVIAMIDLGSHNRITKEGDSRQSRQLLVAVELDATKEDGAPHILGRVMTLSYHKMSELRKFAETIRGKAYAEGESIDYTDLILGARVMVTVEVATSRAGREFAKLKSLTKAPKSTKFEPATEPVFWSMEDGAIERVQEMEWLPWVYSAELNKAIPPSEYILRASDYHKAQAVQVPF